MSNLGFYKALEAQGIQSVQTAVGDRYVVEEMRKNGYNLGGEQSGHIIFLDYNTTGDGLLTALQLVNIMKIKGKPLSELASEMKKYPQQLVNVKVADKHKVMENEKVKAVIQEVEAEMNGNGRVLVRPSGTEPVVRVMAEAPTEEACRNYVERIASVIREEMGAE
jgi:phosphoglucosamine mutase